MTSVLGNSRLGRFDVLIIGSGAGGGIAARVLATNGLKVCVLEAGNNYFAGLDDPDAAMPKSLFSNDEIKLTVRGLGDQLHRVEPRTFRADESRGVRELIGEVNNLPKTVGGGWVHADMKCPRFNSVDFRLGSELGDVSGADFADWPLDYDELEPFYAAAEQISGVAGEAGADPFASPRSGPYPLPPAPPMYVHTLLGRGAEALGLHPFAFPGAQTTRPYRGRPACNDCGYCSGYGCPINAKGSVAPLRDALLTGNVQLRYNATATRLITTAGGGAIERVEYIDAAGEIDSVTADRFVLAASPIESARLCFLSDRGGAGLGNSSGTLGRYLMFHHQTIGVGIYPQDLHGERGRSVTGGISDFRGVPNDPQRPLGGIVEFGANSEKIADVATYVSLGFRGAQLKQYLRDSPFGAHIAVLIMQGEDAPQASNRVDLDPEIRDINGLPVPRITYKPHAFELTAREFYGPKMVELHGAAGAQFAFVSPIYDGDRTPGSRHIMGTLRMGTDPRDSVLDPWCRFHDLDNLYSTDGSPFPTSSGYNPTLTLQALALRTAGAIVDPLRPESVIDRGL